MPSLVEQSASANAQSDWTRLHHNLRRPWLAWLNAAVVCAAAAVLVFVLPLFVPSGPFLTPSSSYIAGFNNPVAVLCAVGLSALVLLGTLWTQRRALTETLVNWEPLRGGFVAGVLLVSACVIALEGWIVTASHTRYLGDAGYFIEQANVRRDTGRALYTQMEFAYGPLLLLPEVWLSRALHCSIHMAYFITLILESTLGLLLLAFVLNALPIRANLRRAAFLLFALGALTPHLGLNYTFFRFITPYALLFFAMRRASVWQAVLLLSINQAVVLLISPELGLAMLMGACTFGLLRAWQAGWSWLAAAAVPLAVTATLLLTLGRSYLVMAASFTHGALNLPVGPYPHTLVLLFALVWLVPFGLGRLLGLRDPFSARMLALYATSVAFIPAALGRCDPLHVFFNGIGLMILSLVVISFSSPRARVAWIGAVALLVLWSQFVDQRFFQVRTTYILAQTVAPHLPQPIQRAFDAAVRRRGPTFARQLSPQPETSFHLDTAALNGLVGTGCVATPVELSPTVEEQLKQTGHYSPGFYTFWVDMMNPTAERRSIADVSRCGWMLLPTITAAETPIAADIAALQGYTLPYRVRNADYYMPGAAFRVNLRQRWRAISEFGPYTLYRQREPAPVAE